MSEFWIRLLYAYPIGVTETLIHQIVDSPYICNYLDMPLQHISHNVLKQMRRPLGAKGTRSLIEHIRTIAPSIALRTTFIVGFPGETEEDVKALESFVAEGHFTHVGVFTYSQEEEALSYHFENQVDNQEKAERRSRIMECQQELVTARFESLVGSRIKVLIEGSHPDTDLLLQSRAAWQAPETDGLIIINDVDEEVKSSSNYLNGYATGRFGTVEITETAGYDLVGTLIAID